MRLRRVAQKVASELGCPVIPTLLGVGFRALSISPPLIPTTKELVRSIESRNLRPTLTVGKL